MHFNSVSPYTVPLTYCLFNVVFQLERAFWRFLDRWPEKCVPLLVFIAGLRSPRLQDADNGATIRGLLWVLLLGCKKSSRIKARAQSFWMLADEVVWAVVSIEKLTSCLTCVCLCTTPFYKLLMIICCESPNGPRRFINLWGWSVFSGAVGHPFWGWRERKVKVRGKASWIMKNDDWCHLLLNNIFTYTFQIVEYIFGHPALDMQCQSLGNKHFRQTPWILQSWAVPT